MTLNDQWNSIMSEIINSVKTLPDLIDVTSNNGFNATTATSPVGTLSAVQFTGLTPGQFVDSFDLSINVALGNIRISIYGDAANSPDQLLGESGSLAVGSTGVVNFRLSKQVEVPQDGILWLSYENDDAGLDLDLSSGQASGTLYTVVHTFGSAPDPFAGAAGTAPFWAQIHSDPKVVKHYGVNGGQPETFYAIVSAVDMRIAETTTRGSNNVFTFDIDLSYYGRDFQDGLTKVIEVSSDIYDLIHLQNLNNTVQKATANITIRDIVEGDSLFLTGATITVQAEKLVFQF